MRKYIHILSFLVFLLFVSLAANARERIDPDWNNSQPLLLDKAAENDDMILQKPFATFSDATGWTHISSQDNWVSSKNSVWELDNFDKLELGWTNHGKDKYLYLNKIFSFIDNQTRKRKKANTVIVIDTQNYINQLEDIKDGDNVMILKVEKYYSSRPEKPNRKIVNGWNDTNRYSNSSWYFAIRFRINKEANTVRFFYYMYNREEFANYYDVYFSRDHDILYMIDLDTNIFMTNNILSSSTPLPLSLSILPDLFQSSELYETVYYETSAKKFLKFINAPLRQDKKSK